MYFESIVTGPNPYERFLKITHSFITKLKMPEKMRARRLQMTTLRPAKCLMMTNGTILIRKAAMQEKLYGRKRSQKPRDIPPKVHE